MALSRNGAGHEAPTDRLTIHYSKRSAHVVPAEPRQRLLLD